MSKGGTFVVTYRVLCIHGVGDHESGEASLQDVCSGLNRFNPTAEFSPGVFL